MQKIFYRKKGIRIKRKTSGTRPHHEKAVQNVKKASIHLFLLAGGAFTGLLALILVYAIPVSPMKEHIYQSLPMLEAEFDSSELVEGYPASLTGSFTDCLMLEHAVYRSKQHTLLEQVLYMYRKESSAGTGWAPGYSLADYLKNIPQPLEAEYARYWHGYLVFLKPLVFLTTFNSIRIMASALQLILAGLIIISCCRRKEEFLGTAFLLSIPFLYFFGLYSSLSLSICFYAMAVLVLVQLRWHEKIQRHGWYGLFFLTAGMITSYFDFLTYPLVTLGFPLCVYFYLDKNPSKHRIRCLIGYSAEWSGGYLGFWALKWVLTDILTKGSTIKDGLHTILSRTKTAADGSIITGFFSVLRQNTGAYLNWGFCLLSLGIFIWLIIIIQERKKEINTGTLRQGCILFAVALYPFIWFFFTQNHSGQHWVYTCKILAVTVFAAICGIGKICGCTGHASSLVPH